MPFNIPPRSHILICIWIIVLMVLPIWVLRQKQTNKLDEATLRDYARWFDEDWNATYGPSINDEFERFEVENQDAIRKACYSGYLPNTYTFGCAQSPLFRERLSKIGAEFGPMLARLKEVESHGYLYTAASQAWERPENPETSLLSTTTNDAFDTVEGLQRNWQRDLDTTYSKTAYPVDFDAIYRLQLLLGSAAIGLNSREEATTHYFDALRSGSSRIFTSGYWDFYKKSNNCYYEMQKLFRFDPDAVHDLRMLRALLEIRENRVSVRYRTLAGMNPGWLRELLEMNKLDYQPQRNSSNLDAIALNLVLRKYQTIQHPKLNAFSNHLKASLFPSDQNSNDPFLGLDEGKLLSYKWTTLPSAQKLIKELIRREPQFINGLLISGGEIEAGDRYTQLVAEGLFDQIGVFLVFSERKMATLASLMEAGFAARVYYARHQAWPVDFDALKPDLLPENFPALHSDSKSTDTEGLPFGPLHMGWLSMDESMRELYCRAMLLEPEMHSISNIRTYVKDSMLHYDLVVNSDSLTTHTAALADYFRLQTDTVESVEIKMRRPQKSDMLPFDLDSTPWLAYDPSTLPKPPKPAAPATLSYGMMMGGLPPNSNSIQMRITAHLKLPDRVFAIWAEGPDGVNDQARSVYNVNQPTSGAGDVVVFPAGF